MEVLENVFRIDTSYSHMAGVPLYLYLVRGDEATALIDTGVPGFWQESVEPYLKHLGLSASSITFILNTHGHPDHFGGNAEVKTATGARICVPTAEAAWVEDHGRHWRELWEGYPGDLTFGDDVKQVIMNEYCGPSTPVDILLRAGDRVDLGGRVLEVVDTPGHSAGHITFYDREHGAVFPGDTVQGHGVAFTGGEGKLGVLYTDVAAYTSSLETLRALQITHLCGAHAYAHTAEAAEAMLVDSLAYIQEVEDLLCAEFVGAGVPLSVPELAQRVSSLTGGVGQVSLQSVSVVHAHLRRLAFQGHLWAKWQLTDAGKAAHPTMARGSLV